MLFFGKKKQKAPAISPADLQRFNRLKDLFAESCEIMGSTKKLSTFLSRYEDLRRFIGEINDILKKTGQEMLLDLYDDVDRDFVDRIGDVVGAEVEAASALRTEKGRKDRLDRIVQELERFDRADGSVIDDAIMEAEDQVYRLIYKDVDWSKMPESGGIGISEDALEGDMKKAVIKEARKSGLTADQAEELWRKTFEK